MGADDCEQLDKVAADRVTLVARGLANKVDQTHEGVLDVATLHVKICHQHLRGDVGGGRSCGSAQPSGPHQRFAA